MADRVRGWFLSRLPRRRRHLRRVHLDWIAQPLVKFVTAGRFPIRVLLHGRPMWINPDNPYPFIVEDVPTFNRPLRVLALSLFRTLRRPLNVVDVGASLGNTALLLVETLGEQGIRCVHCVEGDNTFFELLERNTSDLHNVSRHFAMVASEDGYTGALVHHHPGTAGASGETRVPATTIDHLLFQRIQHCDLFKIDIDGSDGEALAGAHRLLNRDHPAVIFEWHPYLVRQAHNDPAKAFAVLRQHGYRRFLWFTNTGFFSHFSVGAPEDLSSWVEHLIAMQRFGDPHFDVIALPDELRQLELPLSTFLLAD